MIGLPQSRRAVFSVVGAGSLMLGVIVTGGVFYFDNATPSRSPEGNRPTSAISSRSFVMYAMPKPLPKISFEDGKGKVLSLAHFKGKTVLLNIWATWCAPCREEMPTLDALEAELGGPEFEVVPLAVDRAGSEVVRKFFAEIGIKHLELYNDSSMQASFDLGTVGLPTTLLLDSKGRELGRLVGSAEWDSPKMITFLKNQISSK